VWTCRRTAAATREVIQTEPTASASAGPITTLRVGALSDPQRRRAFPFAGSGELKRPRVRVLYRRFWHAMARAKAWPDQDLSW
jgi:hypothetical protein